MRLGEAHTVLCKGDRESSSVRLVLHGFWQTVTAVLVPSVHPTHVLTRSHAFSRSGVHMDHVQLQRNDQTISVAID